MMTTVIVFGGTRHHQPAGAITSAYVVDDDLFGLLALGFISFKLGD